jgi:hypothetical protein
MFPFVFDGRKIAQGGVAARGIVEASDELKDGHPRLAVRSEAAPIDCSHSRVAKKLSHIA